jgi:hypothetical protein
MTHDVVVAEIMARASKLNVLAHYCGRSQLCQGNRGLPDLLCVGLYFGAFIEVKMPHSANLSPEQTNWRHQLRAAGFIHYVVGPGALDNGQIDRILHYLATGLDSGRGPVDSPGDGTR